MVGGLASRLAANPRDPAGWAMLLRSRMVLHQPDQAAKDLATARKALASDPAGLSEVNAAAQAAGVPGA
jgi:cytochrome c-type biogenesis protein CcmH